MIAPHVSPWLVLAGLLSTAPAPGRVRIELATLHVAALTTPRVAGDGADAPYMLISILGPRAQRSGHFPVSGHWSLAENAVVAPTPLEELELAPGDSARVVISVLESEPAAALPERDGADASTQALRQLRQPLLDPAAEALGSALDGLGRSGARRIGAVSLLLTNEGGTLWWRRMDCVADCAVLQGPAEGTGASLAKPSSGVYELIGAGGTYHLKLTLASGS